MRQCNIIVTESIPDIITGKLFGVSFMNDVLKEVRERKAVDGQLIERCEYENGLMHGVRAVSYTHLTLPTIYSV